MTNELMTFEEFTDALGEAGSFGRIFEIYEKIVKQKNSIGSVEIHK